MPAKETIKSFFLKENHKRIIRESLKNCNGNWSVDVLFSKEQIDAQRKETFSSISTFIRHVSLLGSDGTDCSESVEGKSIALRFDGETTEFGDLTTLLDQTDLDTIHVQKSIEGRNSGRRRAKPVQLTDLSPFSRLESLRSLTIIDTNNLTDISALETLTNLETLHLCAKDISNLSPLRTLYNLQYLEIVRGEQLKDITPITTLHSLHTLNLSGITQLKVLPSLEALTNLTSLSLGVGSSLQSIASLSSLQKLTTLDIFGCPLLTNLSFLHNCNSLTKLKIAWWDSLCDITAISTLQNLIDFKLFMCNELTDIEALRPLTNLQVLVLGTAQLDDISVISVLTSLRDLTLQNCIAIIDLSPISQLEVLNTLEISSSENSLSYTKFPDLTKLTQLTHIKFSGWNDLEKLDGLPKTDTVHSFYAENCASLIDISSLSNLTGLTTVSLSNSKSLSDITSVRTLTNLTALNLSSCQALVDISPLEEVPDISILMLNHCTSLTDLTPLQSHHILHQQEKLDLQGFSSLKDLRFLASFTGVKNLTLSCDSLVDLTPLSSMSQLEKVYILDCDSLTDYSPLGNLSNLKSLRVFSRGKTRIGDISFIDSLKNLQSLSIKNSPLLQEAHTWEPLIRHQTLRYIDGPFPASFTTKIIAINAHRDEDRPFIEQNIGAWIKTAQSDPQAPDLLSILAQACSIHTDGHLAIVELLRIASNNLAVGVTGLIDTVFDLRDNPTIEHAIQECIAQKEKPLPPETLLALKEKIEETTLRQNTLQSLISCIETQSLPSYFVQTCRILRTRFSKHSYGPQSKIYDRGARALQSGVFNIDIFGALCHDFALHNEEHWIDSYTKTIHRLALELQQSELRQQAVSDIIFGLSKSNNPKRVPTYFDSLLQNIASFDTDTSNLRLEMAKGYAKNGHWTQAESIAAKIVKEDIRQICQDELLWLKNPTEPEEQSVETSTESSQSSSTTPEGMFLLSLSQVRTAREALQDCDGMWKIGVKQKDVVALLCDHSSIATQAVSGEELVLCFSSSTTHFGQLDVLLVQLSIDHIWIENNPELTNLSMLSGLQNIRTVTIQQCSNLQDLSALRTLPNLECFRGTCTTDSDMDVVSSLSTLRSLSLSGSSALTDLNPLTKLSHLLHLNLGNCPKIEDISPLASLRELKTLDISGVNIMHEGLDTKSQIKDISPLTSLTKLISLNLTWCSSIEDHHPISQIQSLEELRIGGDLFRGQLPEGIQDLAGLPNFHTLEINRYSSVIDISQVSSLKNLKTLRIIGPHPKLILTPLRSLSQLEELDLYFAGFDTLPPLHFLKNLHTLKMSGTPVQDIRSLARCTSLRYLDLSRSRKLEDLSPLSSLSSLETLRIHGCGKIVDISVLSALPNLHNIETFDLGGSRNLTDISPLSSFHRLKTLNLSGCIQILDISPLTDLPIVELDLTRCKELSIEDRREPLHALQQLKQLSGPFTPIFTAQLLASAAMERDDTRYMHAQLSGWLSLVKENPEQENLLSMIGRIAVRVDDVPTICAIIDLSARHSAHKISMFYEALSQNKEKEIINDALDRIIAQEEQLLPPETLLGLQRFFPEKQMLMNQTLTALTRGAKEESQPTYVLQSCAVLSKNHAPTYPIDNSVFKDFQEVVFQQPLHPENLPLFQVLCFGYVQQNTDQREKSLDSLIDHIVSGSDCRLEALYALCRGLGSSYDTQWVERSARKLLKVLRDQTSDASSFWSILAEAHADAERWEDSQNVIQNITDPPVKNTTLLRIATRVLQSTCADRAQRAISLLGGISELVMRQQELYDLSKHDALRSDPIAFGLLVQQLSESPDKQQAAVGGILATRPDFLCSEI